ncbi:AAA family ATPase [Streptomyces capitiformicae]|uniref:ATP-binding protein n=1 Tax=Streptomyces capitiformicae TaxID=2014920 RepID=A0A918ZMA8_9ACTN|nr:AAA family ATPase [Streptomyces capitiformicae]GHE58667.1 ATP-binding protein [Streptomyces capitiformicae]
MYVSRIRVQDIKSFHGPREVDLTLTRPDGSHAGWTVLAGRNGSGKTTLLRAMALALSGPAVARSLVPAFADWVTQGLALGRVEVEITRDATYDLPAGNYDLGRHLKAGLVWEVPLNRGLPSLHSIQYDEPYIASPVLGPWADNPEGWFCAGYGAFRRMAGGSGEVQRLMLASGPVARQATLFHEDASLAEGVAWLIEQHLRALERKTGAPSLKAYALALLTDGLLPDGYRIMDVDSDGLWVERDGSYFPLRAMSDGFRTVAALVVDILKQLHDVFGAGLWASDRWEARGRSIALVTPGVVIIDEIDAHLHVSWQRRIGSWLTSHFPNIQFIVTTHSPYICQSADPGGLIRLPGVDEERPPEVVSEALYQRVVYGSGDDAALSDLFGLDSPYSEQAERKRGELVALEMDILRGQADEETVERHRSLKRLLTSSSSARLDETAAQLKRLADEVRDGDGE